MEISVIIPTLNAEHEIDGLLIALEHQSIQPVEILIVDSASEDKTIELVRQHKRVRLLEIDRQAFNHGTTRDMALRKSSGDFVCFLTQDAVPVSGDYLKRLVAPMVEDPSIALVSGRQLPKADARRFEQLVREFNYPDSPSVRSKGDLEQFGIKTFFASDTCSAYRRSSYLECGGFDHVNTNEDMLMAARFIASGLKVAYEPCAEVYHSHNLTPSQQFARNRAPQVPVKRVSPSIVYCVPSASQLSSTSHKLCLSQNSRTLFKSNGFPSVCAIITAFVFWLYASSSFVTSILY